MLDHSEQEYSQLWRNDHIPQVELLKARFSRFQFSKHWHEELAIGLIQKGAEGLDYKGSKILIPENHIVAINPGEIHTGFAGTEDGWQYRMFYFEIGLIHQVIEDSGIYDVPALTKPLYYDKELYDQLYQLHVSLEKSATKLSRESLLLLALTKLFSRYGDGNYQKPADYFDQKVAYGVKEYLHTHWHLNTSLDELADISSRSKYQVIRAFNSVFHITPHQYAILLKVNHGKRLIKSGMPLADVALECGFYDQSHFTRNFKSAFGVPPKRYVALGCC